MLAVVFRRQIRDGMSYSDFVDAWRAERGYGVKARVLNGTRLEDEHQVLTVGFVGISAHAMKLAERALRHHDRSRHSRIEDVIDGPALVARYRVVAEHHLVAPDPTGARAELTAVEVGSRGSILRFSHARDPLGPPDPSQVLMVAASRRVRSGPTRRQIESARTALPSADASAVLVDALGVDDDSELLSVAFLKGCSSVPRWTREWIDSAFDSSASDDGWSGEYRVRDEHDFETEPVEVGVGSPQSVLGY